MADVAAAIAETCPSHSPPIQCSLEKGHPGYHKLMEGVTLVATWDDPQPATPGGEVADEVCDRLRADLAAARERLAILDALDDRAMESAAASMDDRANTISRLTHTGPTCDARLEMSRQRDDLRRRAAVVRAALSATRGTTETPHE